MPKITYITANGEKIIVENAQGTLMTAAVENQVNGIDGDCGGVCSCATCHVHISTEWTAKVGPASDIELGMLELEDDVSEFSRLACQVELTDELDGLEVKVASR